MRKTKKDRGYIGVQQSLHMYIYLHMYSISAY